MHARPIALTLIVAASLTHDAVAGGIAVSVGLLAAWLGRAPSSEPRRHPSR